MNWISVKDRLPEEEGEYLVFMVEREYPDEYKHIKIRTWILSKNMTHSKAFFGFSCEGVNDTEFRITHWMYLPAAPTEPTPEEPCKKHPRGHKDTAQAFGCMKPIPVPLSIDGKEIPCKKHGAIHKEVGQDWVCRYEEQTDRVRKAQPEKPSCL